MLSGSPGFHYAMQDIPTTPPIYDAANGYLIDTAEHFYPQGRHGTLPSQAGQCQNAALQSTTRSGDGLCGVIPYMAEHDRRVVCGAVRQIP